MSSKAKTPPVSLVGIKTPSRWMGKLSQPDVNSNHSSSRGGSEKVWVKIMPATPFDREKSAVCSGDVVLDECFKSNLRIFLAIANIIKNGEPVFVFFPADDSSFHKSISLADILRHANPTIEDPVLEHRAGKGFIFLQEEITGEKGPIGKREVHLYRFQRAQVYREVDWPLCLTIEPEGTDTKPFSVSLKGCKLKV